MASKSVAVSMFVLRIITLAASAATVALLVTNNVEFEDGEKIKFKDVIAYRFVLSVAVIAAAYTLVQLPLASFYALKQKRLIRNAHLSEFDFYGDKVISLLLASGVGAGIAVSYEFKKVVNEVLGESGVRKSDDARSTFNKFVDMGIIASSVLALALLCMALVSVLSSINRSRK
ncbi:hypothetical protein L6164_006360 [Bauhinia variegata]|uniref:Uncharacterized protein n=1 Tax=Bauhinia variegata TaxID=167791 RepID=A0ACB9PVM8_BAUVA|nr:hypothetical protein L6164_006360 [Bauhinia variegata]